MSSYNKFDNQTDSVRKALADTDRESSGDSGSIEVGGDASTDFISLEGKEREAVKKELARPSRTSRNLLNRRRARVHGTVWSKQEETKELDDKNDSTLKSSLPEATVGVKTPCREGKKVEYDNDLKLGAHKIGASEKKMQSDRRSAGSLSPSYVKSIPLSESSNEIHSVRAAKSDYISSSKSLGERADLREENSRLKLQKVLADSGLGSRRDMEELIVSGRVLVNGKSAHIGQRIDSSDRVVVNGRVISRVVSPPRVLLYYKPAGEICSRDDPENRPTVFDGLPKIHGVRWVSVGRLDFNTEGLLIITTSGDLANALMHPRYGWRRVYAVRVLGRVDEVAAEILLSTGVLLGENRATFSSLEWLGGDGANTWYRVSLAEGRNREVRRIFEGVGLVVSRLVRLQFGPLVLPNRLARGHWVELDWDAVKQLQALTIKQAQSPDEIKEGIPESIDEFSDIDDDVTAAHSGGGDTSEEPRLARGKEIPHIIEMKRFGNPEYMAQWEAASFPPSGSFEAESLGFPGLPLKDSLEEDSVGNKAPSPSCKQQIIEDDDDWQPTFADAHLEGITRAVQKGDMSQTGKHRSKRWNKTPISFASEAKSYSGPMTNTRSAHRFSGERIFGERDADRNNGSYRMKSDFNKPASKDLGFAKYGPSNSKTRKRKPSGT